MNDIKIKNKTIVIDSEYKSENLYKEIKVSLDNSIVKKINFDDKYILEYMEKLWGVNSNLLEAKINLSDNKVNIDFSNGFVYTKPSNKDKLKKLSSKDYIDLTLNFLSELVKFTEQGIDVFNEVFKAELEEKLNESMIKFKIGEGRELNEQSTSIGCIL